MKKTLLLSAIAASFVFTACTPTTTTTPTATATPTATPTANPYAGYAIPANTTLVGDITVNTVLTADKVWMIDGLVAVKNNANLAIEAGTTVTADAGSGADSSYLIVDKGSKLLAEGTAAKPIVFTSVAAHSNPANAAAGQWGGVTLIGKAAMDSQTQPYEANPAFVAGTGVANDNSGILTYVGVYNSGIINVVDKELNGISMVGVGSGTTVNHITIKNSADDCFELWGGTVNMSDVNVSNCEDDQFDIDDAFSGTVTNLTANQTKGCSAVEMSGTTAATFNNMKLTQTVADGSDDEGVLYFKGSGIGGHFSNSTIIDNVTDTKGAIHSRNSVDLNNTSFTNVAITNNTTDATFTGSAATSLETKFTFGTGNTRNK